MFKKFITRKSSKVAEGLLGQNFWELVTDEIHTLLIDASHICITVDKGLTVIDAVIYYDKVKPPVPSTLKRVYMSDYYRNPIMGREFWDIEINEFLKLLSGANHTHITIDKNWYVVALEIHKD
jgi:hypothetical protein